MLMIVLNPIIIHKKTSENNKNVFIFFVSFQQKNTRFSFNYKNDNKKNVLFIIIKTLFDFKTIINFIFQLLIKELGNPENELNEH